MVVEQRGIICRLAGGRRRVKPSPALALAGLATTAFSNVLPFEGVVMPPLHLQWGYRVKTQSRPS